jgi:hypothetical protein
MIRLIIEQIFHRPQRIIEAFKDITYACYEGQRTFLVGRQIYSNLRSAYELSSILKRFAGIR